MNKQRLMDPVRKNWKDAKRTKLEYYIANINLECWVLYKARRYVDRTQPYFITNMNINSHRALTLICTRWHSLGKVCKESLIEDVSLAVYMLCK